MYTHLKTPSYAIAAALAVACLAGWLPPSAATADQAAPAALAERILAAAGTDKGFCVDLAAGDGGLALAVLEKSQFFVHALEADHKRVEAVRRRLAGSGLYGRRTAAEKSALARLPYPDYCANLIVRGDLLAEGTRGVSWKELVRILRPGGLAYVGQSAEAAKGGRKLTAEGLRAELTAAGVKDFRIIAEDGVWAIIRRARPAGAGDWSHDTRCSPGNNPCVADELVKAPFHTSWIAGPRSFTKFGLPLASAGRVLLRHGGITHTGRWKPSARGDLIQAFDAYNGTPLWERRLIERGGNGFVAVGDAVYAVAGTTLYAMSAADGSVRWRLAPEAVVEGMKDWAYYACSDGTLVAALFDELRPGGKADRPRRRKALAGLSPKDGRLIWTAMPAGGVGSVAIGGGLVYYSVPGKALTALEVASGRQRWSRPAERARGLRYHAGRLYTAGEVYSAADGKFLKRGRFSGVFIGDRCYSGSLKGVSAVDLAAGKGVKTFEVPRDPFCPKTGIPDGCRWMYGRCIRRTASTHCYFFSYSGTVIGDLLRNELFPCESFRSNCRTGVIAGNGLVYNSPSGCGCALAVRGGVTLLPVDEAFYWARAESKPPPQLEEGPAFNDKLTGAGGADDWPCHRHDAARSSVTDAALSFPMKQKWTRKLPRRVTPPAVAAGAAFVGCDDHAVYALDASTGRTRWTYRTGGEIFVTPAYWRGRVYAGSQDGWVYCLRADDGRLIWRFRGAPHERKMLFFGRPQSLWPISGGVIVQDGVVNFSAGYCSHDRVFVYALDAATGRVIWKNDKAGLAVKDTGPAGGISPHGVSPGGIPAASKDIFYVPQGMFVPAAFRRSDGKLLWWNWRGDSNERSNIEVQHLGGPKLTLGGGLLFLGGRNRLTGTSHSFTAVDPKTGRFWGADHPALFKKAGRDETGKAVIVKRAMWATKPIRFGQGTAPVVVDGGVFTFGRRSRFRDLKKYLQTQLGPAPGKMNKWPNQVPGGTLIVAGDKVVAVNGSGEVLAVARSDGKPLWRGKLGSEGAVLPDGLAAAGGRLLVATAAGEVVCFAP